MTILRLLWLLTGCLYVRAVEPVQGTAKASGFQRPEGTGRWRYGAKIAASLKPTKSAPAATPDLAGTLPPDCAPHWSREPGIKLLGSSLVRSTVVDPFVDAFVNQLVTVKGDVAKVYLSFRTRFDKADTETARCFTMNVPALLFNAKSRKTSCLALFDCGILRPSPSHASAASKADRRRLYDDFAAFLFNRGATNASEVKLVIRLGHGGGRLRLKLHIPYLKQVRHGTVAVHCLRCLGNCRVWLLSCPRSQVVVSPKVLPGGATAGSTAALPVLPIQVVVTRPVVAAVPVSANMEVEYDNGEEVEVMDDTTPDAAVADSEPASATAASAASSASAVAGAGSAACPPDAQTAMQTEVDLDEHASDEGDVSSRRADSADSHGAAAAASGPAVAPPPPAVPAQAAPVTSCAVTSYLFLFGPVLSCVRLVWTDCDRDRDAGAAIRVHPATGRRFYCECAVGRGVND